MKLVEIKPTALTIDEIFCSIEEQILSDKEMILTESAVTGLLHLYNSIKDIFSTIYAKSGGKNALNDSTLSKIYKEELVLLKQTYNDLPVKVQSAIKPILDKSGIKLSGVDISRNHVHRIVISKLIRYVLAFFKNTLQNPIETVLDALVLGLGKIVSALLNAKDVKGIASELMRSVNQVKEIVKRVQSGR